MTSQRLSTQPSADKARKMVQTIADYQFGKGIGQELFPEETTFGFSKTGRIRYILLGKKRLATMRSGDGRLTIGFAGAERLAAVTEAPAWRVTILDEVIPFIEDGKNAMAKHVTNADPAIQAGDEVLVTGSDGALLATGTAMLSGTEMRAFEYGVAVNVRKGRMKQ